MAKSITSTSTTAQTLDLHVERLLRLAVLEAIEVVNKPDGLDVHCALERAVSKPPAVVCAAMRLTQAIFKTGIWEVACAIDVRMPQSLTGYGEAIMDAIEGGLTHVGVESALSSSSVEIVPGGVIFDQELARELEETSESRVLAFRVYCGLLTAEDGLGTGADQTVLGVGDGNILGHTSAA